MSHIEVAWAVVDTLANHLEVDNPQRWIVGGVGERWPTNSDNIETATAGLRKRERLPLILTTSACESLCAGRRGRGGR